MHTVRLTVPDSTSAAALAQHLKHFAEQRRWRLQYSTRLGYVMSEPEMLLADVVAGVPVPARNPDEEE